MRDEKINFRFNGDVRNREATYVGKDKRGESWYRLDLNKMTGAPCVAWELEYPKQMAKARGRFLCTKSGKVGSLKPVTSSWDTEAIVADNGDVLNVKMLESKTVQLFKVFKIGARSSSPFVVQRSRAILATFIEPVQEDISGADVDLHHNLDAGTTREDLSEEEQANIAITSWLDQGKHRLTTIEQTQQRRDKKGEIKEDYKILSERKDVMNDGLTKLIESIAESKIQGKYMCVTVKTKDDLADFAINHLKNLIEINK